MRLLVALALLSSLVPLISAAYTVNTIGTDKLQLCMEDAIDLSFLPKEVEEFVATKFPVPAWRGNGDQRSARHCRWCWQFC
jgi:hypothetical protein